MIKRVCGYDLHNDDKIFRKETIHISSTSYYVASCTVAGSRDGVTIKPNEDAYSICLKSDDALFACIFDGNSNMKPIKALVHTTGARFASHMLSEAYGDIVSRNANPIAIMIEMNKLLFKSVCDFTETDINDTHTLPATSCTILKIDFQKETIDIAHIGDTFCIVQCKDDSTILVTDDKIKPFDDFTLREVEKLAHSTNTTPKEAVRNKKIRDMIIRRYSDYDNRKDGTGYGELNGQENARNYITSYSLSLDKIRSVFLGTDGIVIPGLNLAAEKDRAYMVDILNREGLESIILEKKQRENSDPDFKKFIRYKHSDDATGISISIK